jgi:hypothetical protein
MKITHPSPPDHAVDPGLVGDGYALQQHGLRPEQGGDVGLEVTVDNEQVGVETRGELAFAGAEAACRRRC